MPTIPNAMQSLNAAVLSDTLDSLALMQQAMKPFMRPLDDTLQLIGRARTGLYMPVYSAPALLSLTGLPPRLRNIPVSWPFSSLISSQ